MRYLALWLLLVPLTAAAQIPGGATSESRPIPDPTTLTTLAQEKATAALRELIDARFNSIKEETAVQKETIQRTEERLVLRQDAVPSLINAAIIQQQHLTDEKFNGVNQQFQGRDTALAAALLAQKTSVDEQNKANAASAAKQDAATTKQIDGIQFIINANSRATDDKIDGVKVLLANQAKSFDDKVGDLRNSLNDIRSSIGIANTALLARGAGQTELWGYLIGGGGFLLAVVGFLFNAARTSTPPPYAPQTVVPNSTTTTNSTR